MVWAWVTLIKLLQTRRIALIKLIVRYNVLKTALKIYNYWRRLIISKDLSTILFIYFSFIMPGGQWTEQGNFRGGKSRICPEVGKLTQTVIMVSRRTGL